MKREAYLSHCGTFRYSLTRRPEELTDWQKLMPIVMLNPSVADENKDDPTICRCLSFAEDNGYEGIYVVNLYAFRATDPENLKKWKYPIGPLNDQILESVLMMYDKVVCAWGNNAQKDRVEWFVRKAKIHDCQTYSIGQPTKKGMPWHPLYVKGGTPLIKYEY